MKLDTREVSVCTHCGSDRVYADAYASINDPTDVLTYQQEFCMVCDGETSTFETTLVEVPIATFNAMRASLQHLADYAESATLDGDEDVTGIARALLADTAPSGEEGYY